jgi:hypothetical protein
MDMLEVLEVLDVPEVQEVMRCVLRSVCWRYRR